MRNQDLKKKPNIRSPTVRMNHTADCKKLINFTPSAFALYAYMEACGRPIEHAYDLVIKCHFIGSNQVTDAAREGSVELYEDMHRMLRGMEERLMKEGGDLGGGLVTTLPLPPRVEGSVLVDGGWRSEGGSMAAGLAGHVGAGETKRGSKNNM